jgi:hypothetical protein
VIERYLAALDRALAGDAAYRVRVLGEAEDHLRSAAEREVDGGATPEEAERRAIAAFGDPGFLARSLAENTRRMSVRARTGLAAACAALTLYYARFLVSRGEPATLLQIVLLLCAAAMLVRPPIRIEVTSWWVVGAALLLLCALVFVLGDHDAHSASDTLNRIVPAYCLIGAFAAGLVRRDRRPATD